MASGRYRRRGAVGTPRPRSSVRVTRVDLRCTTRVDALSQASRPFALGAGATVRMRRSYGSTLRICAVPAHLAPPAGPRCDVGTTASGDEFEARAPVGADAREPHQVSSRASDHGLHGRPRLRRRRQTCLTSRRHRLAPRRLQRDATRVGGRSGLADVERPESNTKSRCRERAFRARVRRPMWSPGRVGLVRHASARNASGRKQRFRGPAPRRPVRSGRRPRRDQRHAAGGAGDNIGTTGIRTTL
jgi:hypothetical protein